jgi:MoaA/NifB/PqqE/SkfB family radical SAM enzyme
MLQWAKIETVSRQAQVIPCRAGRISAVVYANGDVSVCEIHKPLGNLREKSFWELWNSEKACQLRQSIARKDCYCTTEVFLWSSIVYQPNRLLQAILGAKAWRKPKSIMQRQLN